jgi:transcriptional regulator of arginine metabolism
MDELILDLIKNHSISDQDDFLKLILKETGEALTQSTLSRKLKKLGIIKKNGFYALPHLIPQGFISKKENILLIEVLECPPNMLILKTLPKHASALSYILEQEKKQNEAVYPELKAICGMIAGDDCLFVALNKVDQLTPLKQLLINLIG